MGTREATLAGLYPPRILVPTLPRGNTRRDARRQPLHPCSHAPAWEHSTGDARRQLLFPAPLFPRSRVGTLAATLGVNLCTLVPTLPRGNTRLATLGVNFSFQHPCSHAPAWEHSPRRSASTSAPLFPRSRVGTLDRRRSASTSLSSTLVPTLPRGNTRPATLGVNFSFQRDLLGRAASV